MKISAEPSALRLEHKLLTLTEKRNTPLVTLALTPNRLRATYHNIPPQDKSQLNILPPLKVTTKEDLLDMGKAEPQVIFARAKISRHSMLKDNLNLSAPLLITEDVTLQFITKMLK